MFVSGEMNYAFTLYGVLKTSINTSLNLWKTRGQLRLIASFHCKVDLLFIFWNQEAAETMESYHDRSQ